MGLYLYFSKQAVGWLYVHCRHIDEMKPGVIKTLAGRVSPTDKTVKIRPAWDERWLMAILAHGTDTSLEVWRPLSGKYWGGHWWKRLWCRVPGLVRSDSEWML